MSIFGVKRYLPEDEISKPEINVKDIPADVPQFKREYSGIVGRGIKITITVKTYSSRYYTGDLTQPGGRWVSFDPERPADKILDREILPAIKAFCANVLQMDEKFARNPPDSFKDESGQRWCRCK